MGNSSAQPIHDHEWDKFDGVETLGYRVLGVQPDSPASRAGLVSFLDFLVGANGKMLLGSGEGLQEGEEYDDVDFPGLLQEYKGRPVELLVFNIKSQQDRLVELIPRDDWGGAGLLGVTIRLDDYGGADERMIRVLSVEHNSPAAIAGLVASQDYLLGTTTESFDDTPVLSRVLQSNVDQVVELYVYNTNSDVVRVVALMPTWSWGGPGLLGAEVGTGYLHRLPHAARQTSGSSVERKVRWIHQQQSLVSSGPLPQTLEVEPHLEMEPEEGESPEAMTKQPHQVANYNNYNQQSDNNDNTCTPRVSNTKGVIMMNEGAAAGDNELENGVGNGSEQQARDDETSAAVEAASEAVEKNVAEAASEAVEEDVPDETPTTSEDIALPETTAEASSSAAEETTTLATETTPVEEPTTTTAAATTREAAADPTTEDYNKAPSYDETVPPPAVTNRFSYYTPESTSSNGVGNESRPNDSTRRPSASSSSGGSSHRRPSSHAAQDAAAVFSTPPSQAYGMPPPPMSSLSKETEVDLR